MVEQHLDVVKVGGSTPLVPTIQYMNVLPSNISLNTIRYSAAHLLAHAVKQLFPNSQLVASAVTENGFYYDFFYENSFKTEFLPLIEAQMHKLQKENLEIHLKSISFDEAIHLFQALGEPYKLAEIQKMYTTVTGSETQRTVSIYQQDKFYDLSQDDLSVGCTGEIKAFKLTTIAGIFWKNDATQPVLQRIYGTAWLNQKELDDYLYRQQEAKKRDHRVLGKQLDLFHFQENAPGLVFLHAKGLTIYQMLKKYIRAQLLSQGYQEIQTPQLLEKSLWEQSGHWDKFFTDMFITQSEKKEFAIKPMNCPGHVQIFNERLRSYKDLPLRFAEFGCCHRNEPSGALHGLLRVRSFVQDDAHIFCTEEQVQEEVIQFIQSVYSLYHFFGFKNIQLKLATRPEKKVGSEIVWDKAETALKNALKAQNLEWTESVGEGAFYGPKIEFSLTDSLQRVWQCGTVQVDFSMPERLDAQYVDHENNRKTPIMLHRAIVGSLERFMGILLEHHAGHLPFWLAPVQLVVINIGSEHVAYAQTIIHALQMKGIRAQADIRDKGIGFKIREQILQKIPYQIIVGNSEKKSNTISVNNAFGKCIEKQTTLDKFYDQYLSAEKVF